MADRVIRVCRNVNTQRRLVFCHNFRPHVFHNVSDASILRLERLAVSKRTERYVGAMGDNVIANWYTF